MLQRSRQSYRPRVSHGAPGAGPIPMVSDRNRSLISGACAAIALREQTRAAWSAFSGPRLCCRADRPRRRYSLLGLVRFRALLLRRRLALLASLLLALAPLAFAIRVFAVGPQDLL